MKIRRDDPTTNFALYFLMGSRRKDFSSSGRAKKMPGWGFQTGHPSVLPLTSYHLREKRFQYTHELQTPPNSFSRSHKIFH
jgi:hypothetical protein